jgi:predicted PurR-regulated permease PerM
MEKHRLENLSLLVVFAGISILLFLVFAPFFSVLSLAAVFAILLHQPYERLIRFFSGGKNIIAALTVAVMLVFFIVPLLLLGGQIFHEAQSLYISMNGGGAHYLEVVQQAIQGPVDRILPGFVVDINAYVGNALVFISNNLGALTYQTLFIVFETFLMLLAFFFFLRDGRGLLNWFVEASPLGKETTREVLSKMYLTIESVVKGTVVNALVRWLCIWVAFYLFNIPNAVLWSSIGAIVGAIPGLGTPFAFVPAVAYLYLEGSTVGAIGLAIFGIVVVVLIDNVLTTYFFSKGLAVSPIFILFSILGGTVFFGPLGFILGPLVLSIFLSIIHVYSLTRSEV